MMSSVWMIRSGLVTGARFSLGACLSWLLVEQDLSAGALLTIAAWGFIVCSLWVILWVAVCHGEELEDSRAQPRRSHGAGGEPSAAAREQLGAVRARHMPGPGRPFRPGQSGNRGGARAFPRKTWPLPDPCATARGRVGMGPAVSPIGTAMTARRTPRWHARWR
jgi:hypothetical protein